MIKLRVRILEENGNWLFRWDNVAVPTACGLSGPLKTENEAESERQQFMAAEKKKHPWVVFELE